jgi:hypothetical protein
MREDAVPGASGYINKRGRLVSSGGQTSRGERNSEASGSGSRKRRRIGRVDAGLPRIELSAPKEGQPEIYSFATTTDLALLATLIHDAISHLMNAIDKAAKVREPIDRIAAAMEETAAVVKHVVQSQPAPLAASGPKSARSATPRTLPSSSRSIRHNHRASKAKE